jgi:hypothetical protein
LIDRHEQLAKEHAMLHSALFHLILSAESVVNNWSSGDLARAVRELDAQRLIARTVYDSVTIHKHPD